MPMITPLGLSVYHGATTLQRDNTRIPGCEGASITGLRTLSALQGFAKSAQFNFV